MARIIPLVIPTGHVPPSRRCEQCAVDRRDATETQTRKRASRKKEDAGVEDSVPDPEEPTPGPESLNS